MAHALARHVVLVGFMGAGKTTVGVEVARRLARPFHDVDRVVETAHGPIPDIFATRGESVFRELEAAALRGICADARPSVVAVGGGAVETAGLLTGVDALVVALDVNVDTAWERVRGSGRPLAEDGREFRRRYDERRPLYEAVADARAVDADDVVLAVGGIRLSPHTEAVGDVVVADERVAALHRIAAAHTVSGGERAKTVTAAERLWHALRADRASTIVAVGGGSTTDLVGFVAATFLRGIPWIAVPTTLVGQVDAAIGGKTGIDLPDGKNLVGAFHWPVETVIDPTLLATLPDEEHANGLAEVVKTGLLAGEPLWELETEEQVRRCAAFKAAVCLRDPRDEGERAQLNLGHTFAHALEAGTGFELAHGRAVALGLTAALRLSGLEDEVSLVQELLRPEPVRADREAAWAALARDKKASRGAPRLVLLDAPGKPRWGVELGEADVRAALDSLIE